MPFAMISVRMRHYLECFYFCVDMFNDNPFLCKPFVIRFFTLGQFMLLARLYRYPAVRVQASQSLITAAGVYRD
jgi:hypothetical protein